MRHGDLGKADGARKRGQGLLVRREAIAVHQHDRHGADAVRPRGAQIPLGGREIERRHHVAMRGHALVDLDHPVGEHRG